MIKYLPILFLLQLHLLGYSQSSVWYFEKAKESQDAGDYQRALIFYNKAIRQSPQNYDYLMARSYYFCCLINNPKKSLEDINRAILIKSDQSEAYAQRANIYYLLNHIDKSIKDYIHALQFTSSDSFKIEIYHGLFNAHLSKRQYSNGLEDLYEILKIDSLEINALINISYCKYWLGQTKEALQVLEKVIQLDSNSTIAYLNLGKYTSELGLYQKSLEYLNKAEAMGSQDPYLYNKKGYTLYMLSDTTGALKYINKSISIDIRNSYAFLNRGLVYQLQGKYHEACNDWKNALKLNFTEDYGLKVKQLLAQYCKNKF